MNASHRRRTALTLTAAVTAGALAGLGSAAAYALWHDEEAVTGTLTSGFEYFAAGRAGAASPAVDGRASVSIDQTDAAALLADGSIAIALQTDSVSQGNKGLRYLLTEPDWGDGIFGDADVAVFWVATPADCTADAVPATPPATIDGFESTPVSADYSDSTAPVTEHWCLVAQLDTAPVIGSYENTVTATGVDPGSGPVTDTDSWGVDLTQVYDATAEETHVITFDYETFRPEVTP